MEMYWCCCECDTTNNSPDDKHLVCSEDGCDHHLCSDCYNPQQIGKERHLNDQTVTTRTIINKSKAIVHDAHYEQHKMKQKRKHAIRTAKRLLGHYAKHSKIGRAFLSVWSYFQRKVGRKKEHLRIEGKHMPTITVASNSQAAPSNTHYYEPEATYYTEEIYHY